MRELFLYFFSVPVQGLFFSFLFLSQPRSTYKNDSSRREEHNNSTESMTESLLNNSRHKIQIIGYIVSLIFRTNIHGQFLEGQILRLVAA